MRRFLHIVVLLSMRTIVLGQTTSLKHIQCDCEGLNINNLKKGLVSETEAEIILNRFIIKLPFGKELSNIQAIEADCKTSAAALRCPSSIGSIYCIFINNYHIQKINRKKTAAIWEKFILAHELAHHTCGHTGNAAFNKRTPEWLTDSVSKMSKEYEKIYYQTNHKKPLKNHIDELQADIVSLWILAQTEVNFNFKELEKYFTTAIAIEDSTLKNKNIKKTSCISNNDHPCFDARLQQLRKFWKIYSQYSYEKQLKFGSKAKNFETFSEEFYADYFKEVTNWDFDATFQNALMAKTNFRNYSNEPIDAMMTKSQTAMLNISLNSVNKSYRLLNLGLGYTQQQYVTYNTINTEKRTLEKIDHSFFVIEPKLSFNLVSNRKDSSAYKRWKIVYNVGVSMNIPNKSAYYNYATLSELHQTKSTNNPFLEIGFELSSKVYKQAYFDFISPQNFKISARYTYQTISFDMVKPPKLFSSNIAICISMSIFRIPKYDAKE